MNVDPRVQEAARMTGVSLDDPRIAAVASVLRLGEPAHPFFDAFAIQALAAADAADPLRIGKP